MFNRLRWVGLLCVGLLITALPASAQTFSRVELSNLNLDGFPQVEVYLDVHDEQGGFVNNLSRKELSLLEDGKPVEVQVLDEFHTGVQTVLVVNPGNSFAIRDSRGVSRYEQLQEALTGWARSRRGSTVDDYSILLVNGPEQTHFTDPVRILDALGAYQFDARSLTPTLDILLRAIDIASDATPRPGMERIVLFVTPLMPGDLAFGVQSLISRANQQGVHIFVWLVASPMALTTPTANLLLELATQTGGEAFTFSGVEPVPNLEMYLGPMREIYHLAYQSKIKSGGVHRLEVTIRGEESNLPKAELEFDLDLQPPELAFLAPAVEIKRRPISSTATLARAAENPNALVPEEHQVHVLFNFPDGRSRPIVRSALYVDGSLVDQNTAPPFDVFTWDLRPYTEPGPHLLQAEVVDNLGLKGQSIESLVQLEIEQSQVPGVLVILYQNWPAVTGLAALLIAAVVLLVLVARGRITPASLRQAMLLRRSRGARGDQVEVPAVEGTEMEKPSALGGRRFAGWVNRLHWPHSPGQHADYGRLVPYEDGKRISSDVELLITAGEMTIGRDSEKATLILSDASVDPLHARLVLEQNKRLRIIDESSVAGTGVNFAPLPPGGTCLLDGDIVQIGKVVLRYASDDPAAKRKIVVSRLEIEP